MLINYFKIFAVCVEKSLSEMVVKLQSYEKETLIPSLR